jgi:hypothetical protein
MSSASCNVRKASYVPQTAARPQTPSSNDGSSNYYNYRLNKEPSDKQLVNILNTMSHHSKKMLDSSAQAKSTTNIHKSPKPFSLASNGVAMPKEDLNTLMKDLEKLELS